MKIILGLITFLSLSAYADRDARYDMFEQNACVLQIMKEAPASLVEACGAETLQSFALTPFSKMEQPSVFQAAMKQNFLSKLDTSKGMTCREWDNSTALILICTLK